MIIDLLILLAFVIYSVSIGFRQQKNASRNLEEYFLAGRTLKGWQSGFSMAATQYAADTPLLVTGLIATAGIFSLWRLWVYALAFLLMGFVLGACWRRAGILTDAEFTELRYSGRWAALLRAFKAVHLGTIINCTVLAMVLIAATRLAEPFLIWHEWLPQWAIDPLAGLLAKWHLSLSILPEHHPELWLRSADNLISILLIVSFTTLYSTTGGLRSVVATDVVQFLIAMTATGAYAWIVVAKTGGLHGMLDSIQSMYGVDVQKSLLSFGPSQFNEVTFIFIAVLAVQWFAQINADGTGYLAQRTMGCRSDRDAKCAAVIFTFAQIVVRSLIWIPIGLALLVLYPAESLPLFGTSGLEFQMAREATFAIGIKDFLPAGVRGLMMTGMLAALASTVDTHLNWGASYWTNDLYKRFVMKSFLKREAGNRELVWAARLSNIGILTIALMIMVNLRSIQTAWHISLLFGSGLGAVLILRWIWYRINIWSELSAGIVSFTLAPLLLFWMPEADDGTRLLIMAAGSTLIVVIVTLLTPPEPQEKLLEFYRRVKPLGFWGPIAAAAEPDDKAKRAWPVHMFYRMTAATILCSCSVFLLLTGIGNIMLSPSSLRTAGVHYLFIAAGLALCPVWFRLGFGNDVRKPAN